MGIGTHCTRRVNKLAGPFQWVDHGLVETTVIKRTLVSLNIYICALEIRKLTIIAIPRDAAAHRIITNVHSSLVHDPGWSLLPWGMAPRGKLARRKSAGAVFLITVLSQVLLFNLHKESLV